MRSKRRVVALAARWVVVLVVCCFELHGSYAASVWSHFGLAIGYVVLPAPHTEPVKVTAFSVVVSGGLL